MISFIGYLEEFQFNHLGNTDIGDFGFEGIGIL